MRTKILIAALSALVSTSAWAESDQRLEVYEGRWDDTGSVCRMTLRYLPDIPRDDIDFWRFAQILTNATDAAFQLFTPSRFLENGWASDLTYPTRMLVVTFVNESSPVFAYGVVENGETKTRVCKDTKQVEDAPDAEESMRVPASQSEMPVFSLAATRTNPFYMKNAEAEWFNFPNLLFRTPDYFIVVRSAQTPRHVSIQDGYITTIKIDFSEASRLSGEEKCAYLLSKNNLREKYDTLVPLPSSGKHCTQEKAESEYRFDKYESALRVRLEN